MNIIYAQSWLCVLKWLLSANILITLSLRTMAGVESLSPEMNAHVFYVEAGETLCPVMGVESRNEVIVALPDKSEGTIKFTRVKWVEQKLPPVGRITVCSTEGETEHSSTSGANFLSTSGNTSFDFEVVADRDLPDVYIVLILELPRSDGKKTVAFAKFGSLTAGELFKKKVYFQDIIAPEGTTYSFEFYKEGMPIERWSLHEVAGNPRSKSLLIPWDQRLSVYLDYAKRKKLNDSAISFHQSIRSLDPSSVKGAGIEEIKVTLIIKKDGTTEFLNCEPRLPETEHSLLQNDLLAWRFFPVVEKGKPQEIKVAVPIQF